VAAYPFTTLHPNLGVVSVEAHRSFVVADIPGVIEGAAEGAGLGLQFLRHLSRTHLLLHVVDVAPLTDTDDPVQAVRAVEAELSKFSPELAARERWLVLNKVDMLPEDERAGRVRAVVKQLGWQGPAYPISAINGGGCRELAQAVMVYLEKRIQDTSDKVQG
jgi:GTP-binding protein